MTQMLKQIDVRTSQGTFLITTMSGVHYIVIANQDAGGRAIVSGGSRNFGPRELNFDGPPIRLEERIFGAEDGRLRLTTSAVCAIRQIDQLSPEQIDVIIKSDLALLNANHNGAAWWSSLLPPDL